MNSIARGVLTASSFLGVFASAAQANPGVVLFQCGPDWVPVGQSSDGAPFVDASAANCTEELRRVLSAGYAIAFAGNGQGTTPFFVLVEQVPPHPSAGPEAAVVLCRLTHRGDDFVVGHAGSSAGVPQVRTGAGARCADELSRLLASGLSFRHANFAKDYPSEVYFTFSGGERAAVRSAPRKKRRLETALVSCEARYDVGAVPVLASFSSDPTVPANSLNGGSCGEALSVLLRAGYRILDVEGGQSGHPVLLSLIRP